MKPKMPVSRMPIVVWTTLSMSTSVQRCIGAPRRLLGAVVPADSRAGGVPFDQKPPVGVEVLLEQPAAGDVFAAYVHPFAEVGVVEARLSDPSPAHDDDSGEHGAVKVAEPDFGLFESGPFDLAVAEVAPCDLRPAETAVAQHGLAEGDALHPAAVEIALRERAFVECHVFHTAAFEIDVLQFAARQVEVPYGAAADHFQQFGLGHGRVGFGVLKKRGFCKSRFSVSGSRSALFRGRNRRRSRLRTLRTSSRPADLRALRRAPIRSRRRS